MQQARELGVAIIACLAPFGLDAVPQGRKRLVDGSKLSDALVCELLTSHGVVLIVSDPARSTKFSLARSTRKVLAPGGEFAQVDTLEEGAR